MSKDFLILGNAPSLKLVDFELVRKCQPALTVVGINRSYLAYPDHDLMYVQDVEPIVELFGKGLSDEELAAMNIKSSGYFDKRIRIMSRRRSYTADEISRLQKLRKNGIVGNCGPRLYPGRGPWSIDMAIATTAYRARKEFPGETINYYIAGVDLRHRKGQNHFYSKDPAVKKTLRWPNEGSNKRQLSRQLSRCWRHNKDRGFKSHNLNVVTCDSNSLLRKYYSYVELSDVLKELIGEKPEKAIVEPPDPAMETEHEERPSTQKSTQGSARRHRRYTRHIQNARSQRKRK